MLPIRNPLSAPFLDLFINREPLASGWARLPEASDTQK
jgi:hypothetical protein